MLYSFKDKDPILDVLHRLFETRAKMEGLTFHKVMLAVSNESKGEVSYAMLNNWFYGKTISPRYCSVARVYIAMRAYSRKPIAIGDRHTNVVDLTEARAKLRRSA